jgi:hypothetical protein
MKKQKEASQLKINHVVVPHLSGRIYLQSIVYQLPENLELNVVKNHERPNGEESTADKNWTIWVDESFESIIHQLPFKPKDTKPYPPIGYFIWQQDLYLVHQYSVELYKDKTSSIRLFWHEQLMECNLHDGITLAALQRFEQWYR